MLELCATALAALVALVFATAAVFKLGDKRNAIDTFSAMGFVKNSSSRFASVLFVGVVGLEFVSAVALIVVPPAGALLGLVVLGAFTVVLARTAKTRPTARCACFGSASQRPIGLSTFVRNGMLMLGLVPAVAVLLAGGSVQPQWGLGSVLFGVGAALVGVVVVQLAVVSEDARARALAGSQSGLKAVL